MSPRKSNLKRVDKLNSPDAISRPKRLRKQRLINPQRQRTLLTWRRVVRYGLRNFARNAWLTIAATVVMVITLLIIFATGVASSVLNETIESQKDKMDLSVYIKHDASDKTLNNLADQLKKQANVKSVTVSNSASERKNYVDENKENSEIMDALELVASENVTMDFPAVLHVKLEDYNLKDDIQKYISNDKQFKKWVDQSRAQSQDLETRQNTINRLSDIMGYAGKVGMVAAGIFIVISVLIIFNTIRMTIFARRDEISMMRSIGADNFFIRGPFLVEAELYGLIAGVVATIIGYLALAKIMPGMGGYIEVTETQALVEHWMLLILLGMMGIGYIIGNISARLALRRYMKW